MGIQEKKQKNLELFTVDQCGKPNQLFQSMDSML